MARRPFLFLGVSAIVLSVVYAAGMIAGKYFLDSSKETVKTDDAKDEKMVRHPRAARVLGRPGGMKAAESEVSEVVVEPKTFSDRREARFALSKPDSAVDAARFLLAQHVDGSKPTVEDARAALAAARGLQPERAAPIVADALDVFKRTSLGEYLDELRRILLGAPREVKNAALLTLTAGVADEHVIPVLLEALKNADTRDLAHKILVSRYSQGTDYGFDARAWERAIKARFTSQIGTGRETQSEGEP